MVLTNSQYEQFMTQYYEKQLRSRSILEEHISNVKKSIPEYQSLDDKIRDLSLQHAKEKLQGISTFDLSESIDSITKQKEDLLTSHGFPVDYLKPSYDCPDCKDTGYIGDNKCHCFEKAIVDFLYAQSNLKDVLALENFEHFNFDYYPDDFMEETTNLTPRENIRKIHNTAVNFVKYFEEDFNNLLLYGNTGVGKTFLTNCIAKELLDSSHTVVYLTALKFFDILSKNKFDKDLSSQEKSATVSYILDSDLLIIDDLGTELSNSFTSSELYQCIDSRLQNKKATVISTNLSFDDLRDRYSERVFSRITSNYTLLKLTGDDIRLKKALEKNK